MKKPIHIIASKASKSAVKAVEQLGGTIFCKYYNDLALRDCVHGRTDRTEATPTKRNDISMFTLETSSNIMYLRLCSLVYGMEEQGILVS